MNEGNKDIDPITYILFGATGNLAQIKIMPALCALFESGKLPFGSKIVTFSRRHWDDNDYREFIKPSLQKYNETTVSKFLEMISYVEGVFENEDSYKKLKSKIVTNKVFIHLAVLPESYVPIVKGLGGVGIKGILLIEKPFGHDGESSEMLNASIVEFFPEQNILRVDHYLCKPGAQAIVDKKRNDSEFELRLNNKNVTKIICRFREVIDVGGRGEFYDKTGAFRDMGQSHGLQIIASTIMNTGQDINVSRADAIESLSFVPRSLICGQYEGYKDEKGVSEYSDTETYFRIMLQSDNDRWSGVQIVLEAGKALEMNNRKEEVVICYEDGTEFLFDIDIPKHYNAYQVVLEEAFNNSCQYFVSMREVCALWVCADEVIKNMKSIPLIQYKKGQGPNFIL